MGKSDLLLHGKGATCCFQSERLPEIVTLPEALCQIALETGRSIADPLRSISSLSQARCWVYSGLGAGV